MSEGLGLWLRHTRESRRLTLNDAEKALRIRRRYLEALELGDYAALPGEIQARGFLRNYARFLGLSVDEALARYDAEVQGRPVQPRATPPAQEMRRVYERPSVFAPPPSEEEEVAKTPAPIPSGVLIALVGAIAFFILTMVVSFVLLQIERRKSATTEPAASPSAVAPIAATATLSTTAVVETPATPPTFIPSASGQVNVRLIPREHAWISVSADERIVYQGIAAPGEVIEASASEILIVATGNGGAFQLYVNGTDWGLLGSEGAIVRRAWTPKGETSLEEP